MPLSLTTSKLMLACWAQVWAAVRIAFSQVAVDHLLLKVANRLLVTPPAVRTVPSGTKLMVMSSGCVQALLLALTVMLPPLALKLLLPPSRPPTPPTTPPTTPRPD